METNFKPTEQPVIEATIGRAYEKPKLKAPYFKEDLIDFSNQKFLQPTLEELAKEDKSNG